VRLYERNKYGIAHDPEPKYFTQPDSNLINFISKKTTRKVAFRHVRFAA